MASVETEDEEPLYEWLEDVEDLESYRPGGYHPIHIDDEIKNRYCVVHKLGFGSYSTVWLARDQQLNRFVAMKVSIASASTESSETRILHHIRVAGHQHPGREFVTTLLDDFDLEGPNGRHRCLITEVTGPSVGKVRYETPGNRLPTSVARRIASQSAKGLAFLHSCGVVHGGKIHSYFTFIYADHSEDFHYNNVLFEIPNFHSWSVEEVYRHLGEPRKKLVKRTDGTPTTPAAPSYVVMPPDPLQLAGLIFDSNDWSIKITDFGESFLTVDTKKPSPNIPISVAAPEILFQDSIISPKVDIWSLACLIYEVFSNHGLIESFFNDLDEVMIEMVRTFGKLPERWWTEWENRDQYFEENGTFKLDSGDLSGEPRTVNLKERLENIRRRDEMGQKELSGDLEALELVLGKMLRYEPEERISIDEVVSLLPF
ncbi:hypothetical protein C0992_011541 [Termitomyces sp. T32_za158]|nr:hypothetical protein C0992_011541 [Termitomyces sp. T32_za158]